MSWEFVYTVALTVASGLFFYWRGYREGREREREGKTWWQR